MIHRRQNSSLVPDRQHRSAAFVLAEAALVLVVVLLAAWLALDLAGRVLQRRRCDQFIADLRDFSAAFQRYARLPKAAMPARPNEAALPPAVMTLLRETNWAKGSPFGGTYEWLPPKPAPGAAPAVPPPAPAAGKANGPGATASGSSAIDPSGTKAANPAINVAPGPTATGGRPGTGPAAAGLGAITVTAFAPHPTLTLTRADMLYIDRQIDDGDLATGRFRAGFNGWPQYSVNAK